MRITAKKGGSADLHLTARENGQQVGTLHLRARGTITEVKNITVDPAFRRRGVATRLYERGAREACKRFGKPLASDETRTEAAEAFWRKQAAKGRATCRGDGGNLFVPGGSDKDGHWACGRWVLACPAPRSLKGAKRR